MGILWRIWKLNDLDDETTMVVNEILDSHQFHDLSIIGVSSKKVCVDYQGNPMLQHAQMPFGNSNEMPNGQCVFCGVILTMQHCA